MKMKIKTTIYVTEMTYMGNSFPARETVSVKALPLGAILEISMIAVKS